MEKKTIRPSIGGSGEGKLLLHDLVAEEILTRLPANSLMRFTCVCKLWRSTILDPCFQQVHRARSLPSDRVVPLRRAPLRRVRIALPDPCLRRKVRPRYRRSLTASFFFDPAANRASATPLLAKSRSFFPLLSRHLLL
ncbi:hypothetical protein Acr_19g0007530 [Actinidia rufa]|uniref:F-box domain-containing protein n=1 Tax=Actinidia rufa TaxID=165716 RepID=A0A7J0GAH3_9ERIC|nr:hypothetical protein Acr_19g0007530 [Actinidia rufa]